MVMTHDAEPSPMLQEAERELEYGAPRNTPPDNPHGEVKTYSNE